MPVDTSPASNEKNGIPVFVKLLAVLMTFVFGGLGVLAIITEYDVGQSRHHGLVVHEGDRAILFGVVRILIGLTPLAILMPTKRSAAWFAGICISSGIALIFLSPAIL